MILFIFIQLIERFLVLQKVAHDRFAQQVLKNGGQESFGEQSKSPLLCTFIDDVRTSLKALTDYSVFNIVASW
ncbi:MAG: hypothetical protein A3A28_01030 [Candidatus Sungbacteria bacterium RIFCSPLOWO2_01_FULL_47_32]|uniref:Uncharacterized protein n=1 Tax=Candidatus Sungbacteria bacterium RIFCSPHIGHO2_01_FULL_47_32 TaxID=1802264 RepID=A0A1G2K919_9BACT|nr:MAG: hypothetical protein A2633_02425 [Candidatus Sungbacteria bacterium RIFCSPHIGHO2_01_FULL_47_32]OHA06176.1 MAG: hypothetical protein A3A28_01030 [Candidatus Sungbacteria bacterium RIFCSPLOWO2_01_FULL_47_32]